MERHIKVLGVLNIVLGAIGCVIGLIVLLVFGGAYGVVAVVSQQTPAAGIALPVIAIVGGAIAALMLVASAPAIIAGIGLCNLKPWSWILSVVVSALHLLNMPFGTALGIYGLWVLLSKETQRLLGRSQ